MTSDLSRLLHLHSISDDDPLVNKEIVSHYIRNSSYSDLLELFNVSSGSPKKQKIFFRDLIIKLILDYNVPVTWFDKNSSIYTGVTGSHPKFLDLPSNLFSHLAAISTSHQFIVLDNKAYHVHKPFISICIDGFYIPTYSFYMPHLFADIYRLLLVTYVPFKHPYFPTAHKAIQSLYFTHYSFAQIFSSLSSPPLTTADVPGFDRDYQFLILLHAHLAFYLTNSSFFLHNFQDIINFISSNWLSTYQISRILLSRYFSFSDIKFEESLDPLP